VQIKDQHQYDTLAKRQFNKNHLVEKYVIRKAFKGKYFDTTYYSFSKDFIDMPYTLSSELDSARKMKLYKVRFIFSETIAEPRKPKREFSYEIRNVEVQNKEKVIAFFDDFISSTSPASSAY
jgi:hypothetical protein